MATERKEVTKMHSYLVSMMTSISLSLKPRSLSSMATKSLSACTSHSSLVVLSLLQLSSYGVAFLSLNGGMEEWRNKMEHD